MHLAPLNVFQRTQRLWDRFHPYNAAQCAVLTTPRSRACVEEAFNLALSDLRLGTFVCADGQYWIDRQDARRVEVPEVEHYACHLSSEMNRAFDPLVSMPFRPFVCPSPDGQILGLVYQHWMADSVSIRMVMRAWLSRLLGRPELRPAPARLDPLGLAGRFGPEIGKWSLVAQSMELFKFASDMKHVRRVPVIPDNGDVSVLVTSLPRELITGLRRAARARRVTVGDVFLAAAAEACALHAPNIATRRRPDLAMGTIVDLRPRHPQMPADLFGLYLGFMVSTFSGDHLDDFDSLLTRAHTLRRMQSHRRSPEASQMRMLLGLWIARFVGDDKLMDFYRRRFPLAGGISNVNLTPEWPGTLYPDPLAGYHRISPTGPLMPLVLTPTTLGDACTLCCTYRTALSTRERAGDVVSAFLNRLSQFA